MIYTVNNLNGQILDGSIMLARTMLSFRIFNHNSMDEKTCMWKIISENFVLDEGQ